MIELLTVSCPPRVCLHSPCHPRALQLSIVLQSSSTSFFRIPLLPTLLVSLLSLNFVLYPSSVFLFICLSSSSSSAAGSSCWFSFSGCSSAPGSSSSFSLQFFFFHALTSFVYKLAITSSLYCHLAVGRTLAAANIII